MTSATTTGIRSETASAASPPKGPERAEAPGTGGHPTPGKPLYGLLKELMDIVKSGAELHPRKEELPTLAKDLEREWLLTAAVDPE